MKVVDALLKVATSRSPDVGRIAEALRADPATGLARLVRMLEGPVPEGADLQARQTALDALRTDWRAAVEPMLASLRNRPIPLAVDELATFHRVALALRALRDAYRGIHEAQTERAADAQTQPRALRAIARALEAQSHLLVAACRLRIALPRDDWDAACRLAIPLRDAAALETPYADPSPAVRPDSPREALVLPMLLRLIEPLGLAAVQLDVAGVLARRLAGGVGARIDVDGLPHVSPHGPTLMLSAHHAVRLDTRAALERLSRARQRLAQGDSRASIGLRTSLSTPALEALFVALETVWGPCHVPRPLARPPLPFALMCVGLPTRPAATEGGAPEERRTSDESPAVPPGDAAAYSYGGGAAAPAAGRPPYLYGRAAEAAYVERRGSDLPDPTDARIESTRGEQARQTMQAIAEPVEWLGHDGRRTVFTRTAAQPRLMLGQLVAVMPVRAIERAGRRGGTPSPSPLPQALPLRLGRVATLAQTGAADGRDAFAHDVGVAFWPGAAVPVRVRTRDATAFEDAWWIPEVTEDSPSSLLVRRDRLEPPCSVVVREGAEHLELRVVRILERGPDFDRLEVSGG